MLGSIIGGMILSVPVNVDWFRGFLLFY